MIDFKIVADIWKAKNPHNQESNEEEDGFLQGFGSSLRRGLTSFIST